MSDKGSVGAARGKLGKRVRARLLYVSPAAERRFHKENRCSGELCPLGGGDLVTVWMDLLKRCLRSVPSACTSLRRDLRQVMRARNRRDYKGGEAQAEGPRRAKLGETPDPSPIGGGTAEVPASGIASGVEAAVGPVAKSHSADCGGQPAGNGCICGVGL